MTDSAAHQVATHIVAQGICSAMGGVLDWAAYVGSEPAGAPSNCVTFYDTGGGEINGDAQFSDPTIQVRVRAKSYADGYDKAMEIRDQLIYPTDRTIGTYHYAGFWLISDVAKIGRDQDERELFTVNFRAMRTNTA